MQKRALERSTCPVTSLPFLLPISPSWSDAPGLGKGGGGRSRRGAAPDLQAWGAGEGGCYKKGSWVPLEAFSRLSPRSKALRTGARHPKSSWGVPTPGLRGASCSFTPNPTSPRESRLGAQSNISPENQVLRWQGLGPTPDADSTNQAQ